MNYANLIAGVTALHHINQEPQITLIRATLDFSAVRRVIKRVFSRVFSRVFPSLFSSLLHKCIRSATHD